MTIAHRITKPLGAALVVAAVAAPVSVAKPIESTSPELKGSKASTAPSVATDLRSPDAVDAATPRTDLRSPDAVDAGRPLDSGPAPIAPVIRVVEEPSGFDWGDAGIGAGTVLLLSLLAVNGSTLVARRRVQRAANA